jgi:ADP-ribosyl-[dinitrogen reductase] hydrolase
MRTAPLALRYAADGDALERFTRADSSLTHHDPLAADACVHLNRTLAALVRGTRPPEPASEAGRVAQAAVGADADALLDDVHRRIGFVLTALRVGFAAGLGRDSFEDAVVFAVNLGGDADTNGAVAGALAGARFGAGAIPERWLAPLRARERIHGLAVRLMRG